MASEEKLDGWSCIRGGGKGGGADNRRRHGVCFGAQKKGTLLTMTKFIIHTVKWIPRQRADKAQKCPDSPDPTPKPLTGYPDTRTVCITQITRVLNNNNT